MPAYSHIAQDGEIGKRRSRTDLYRCKASWRTGQLKLNYMDLVQNRNRDAIFRPRKTVASSYQACARTGTRTRRRASGGPIRPASQRCCGGEDRELALVSIEP